MNRCGTPRPHPVGTPSVTPGWRRAIITLVGVVSGLGLSVAEPPAGRAQSAATTPQPSIRFEAETSVAWVLVPVVVRRQGRFLTKLKASDFTVTVGNRRIEPDSFDRAHDGPVSLIHLQDLSGSMATSDQLATGRRVFEYFLDRARSGDEFALATFASGRTLVDVPFTSDLDVHREAATLWRAYGTTALHDAVAWLPEIGLEGRNVRRVALLVTDGADNASALAPARAREMVRQARLPVYVIALGDNDPRQPRVPSDANTDESMLRLLAHRTGGRYFAAAGSAEEACQTIVDEIRHQYVIGFRIRGVPESDRAYRPIRVDVRRSSSLEVTHRLGYTGGPPAAVGQ